MSFLSDIIMKEIGLVRCQNSPESINSRHKSNGFIAYQKLSFPAATASYEAEDHVEDSRVRNANCNYDRADDILRL